MAFEVIGHRGASGHAPENTAPSFDLALRLDVDALELDLRMSKDGVPFVIHDANVDRVSDGSGAVGELTSAELKALDVGSWFHPAYRGTRFLLMDEALTGWGDRIPIVAEAKEADRRLLSLLFEAAERTRVKALTVSSFSLSALRLAREISPDARLSWLVRTETELDEILRTAPEFRPARICPKAGDFDREWVRRVKAEGYGVRAWGLPKSDAPAMVRAMRSVIDAGADGTTADFPDVMRTTLLACDMNM